MAAFFVDLDGTVFKWGTEKFLPNVENTLKTWERDNNQIFFTTMRDEMWAGEARKVLTKILNKVVILTKVDSPRVVVNDAGAYAIPHPRDEGWPPWYADSYKHLEGDSSE
jgi:ribonucleotide monophosphatase NagD (HAD superfamily)